MKPRGIEVKVEAVDGSEIEFGHGVLVCYWRPDPQPDAWVFYRPGEYEEQEKEEEEAFNEQMKELFGND